MLNAIAPHIAELIKARIKSSTAYPIAIVPGGVRYSTTIASRFVTHKNPAGHNKFDHFAVNSDQEASSAYIIIKRPGLPLRAVSLSLIAEKLQLSYWRAYGWAHHESGCSGTAQRYKRCTAASAPLTDENKANGLITTQLKPIFIGERRKRRWNQVNDAYCLLNSNLDSMADVAAQIISRSYDLRHLIRCQSENALGKLVLPKAQDGRMFEVSLWDDSNWL